MPGLPFWGSFGTGSAPCSTTFGVFQRVFFGVCSEEASGRPFSAKGPSMDPSRGGVDLQSVRAGAGFMKVDPFSKKWPPRRSRETISGVLAPFWEPLGSTLRTLSRPRADLSPHCACSTNLHDFNRKRVPPKGVGGQGAAGSGTWGILHLGPWTVVSPCVFEHSARRVPAQPRGEVTFSDFSLQVSLQEPLG